MNDAEPAAPPSSISGDAPRARASLWRTVLGGILLMAGLYFMAITLRGQFSELAAATIAVPWHVYAAITLLATVTVLLTAALHAAVVADGISDGVDAARVRHAYAASQVARYVPGKIFGVVLEAHLLAPALTVRQVVVATLVQTALVYAWAVAVAIAVIGAIFSRSALPALLMPLVLLLLWLAQRNRWLLKLCALWKSAGATDHSVATMKAGRHHGASAVIGLLMLQWLPFFGIWFLLAVPTQGSAAALWVGASYLLASIGGSLLVLLPSGLVVREAVFVWLGALYGLPAPELAGWAIVVRIALTLADVLAVPLLWAPAALRRNA